MSPVNVCIFCRCYLFGFECRRGIFANGGAICACGNCHLLCLYIHLHYDSSMHELDAKLKEFIDLYESEFGERLSELDAKIEANKLVTLVELLIRPLPLPPGEE
jgi:Zn-finger protein